MGNVKISLIAYDPHLQKDPPNNFDNFDNNLDNNFQVQCGVQLTSMGPLSLNLTHQG